MHFMFNFKYPIKMKRVISIFALLIISLGLFANTLGQKYTGKLVENSYKYIFEDENGEKLEFDEFSEDLTIDLDSEAMVGKTFTIEYETVKEEIMDENGEPTGETASKTIIVKAELQK